VLLGRASSRAAAGLRAISAAAQVDTAISRAPSLALVNGAGQPRIMDLETGSLARTWEIALLRTSALLVVAARADAAAHKLAKQVYFLEVIGLEACHLLHLTSLTGA
jgi:hypothetical protein